MAFGKMIKNVLNISGLEDKPSCSSTTLKGIFDAAGVSLKEFINALIDQIEDETAAENIGANVGSVATKNLQAILNAFDEAISNRYTKDESDAFVSEETNNLIADFDINLTTGVITVTRKDGTIETYDTALEKVPATFTLVEENEVYYLKITNTDGTSTKVNVNTLFNEYLFINSDEIAFEVTNDGNSQKVTARIRDNSIGKGKISLDLITQLEEYVQSSSSSATSASNSATSAKNSASSASASANTAIQKANEASTSAINAKTSENNAKESESNAKCYYDNIYALIGDIETTLHRLNSGEGVV